METLDVLMEKIKNGIENSRSVARLLSIPARLPTFVGNMDPKLQSRVKVMPPAMRALTAIVIAGAEAAALYAFDVLPEHAELVVGAFSASQVMDYFRCLQAQAYKSEQKRLYDDLSSARGDNYRESRARQQAEHDLEVEKGARRQAEQALDDLLRPAEGDYA